MEAPAAEPGHSPQRLPLQLLLAFLFAAAVAVGLCASAILRRSCGARGARGEEMPTRGGGGWCSRVDAAAPSSPLWQRRILMGERCELPRFSGLILYDEQGFPLHGAAVPSAGHPPHQDKPVTVVTTLKDLL